jgi:hypothetical protein
VEAGERVAVGHPGAAALIEAWQVAFLHLLEDPLVQPGVSP